MAESKRQWRFFRAGGFDQLLLESGEDLLALGSLDQKLWVSLSCPVQGVEFDRRTLEFLDADRDGHIRAPELLAALTWAGTRLSDPGVLLGRDDGLPLAAINDTTDEGRRILASARTILANLGNGDADRITVDDACDSGRIFARSRFNGDGVITTITTDDERLDGWLGSIMECCGNVPDRSGEPGVSLPMIEQFGADAAAWLAWQSRADDDPAIRGLGEERTGIIGLWSEVKEKIEDYFLRCRLAAFDGRAAQVLNGPEDELQGLAAQNLTTAGEAIAGLPLAAVNAGQTLDLEEGINPAWQERIERFRREIVHPLLGDERRLSAMEWEAVKARFAPAEAWWSCRVDVPAAALGGERLRDWADSGVEAVLRELIDRDLELKEAAEAMVEVEQLARYCRDLYAFINNFVSFRDFYTCRSKAIFQSGTLYLDGRSCELCVTVTDIAKHAALATLSRLFLVYCDCVRNGGADRMTIAAAVTNGDADQLMVGRNGVFYDRKGNDWHATIVRIVDHPISIRQAFWAPYKRIARMVGDQLQKIAAARSKAAEEKTALSLMHAGDQKPEAAKPAQQAFDAGKFAGIFAAIGLAIGAIGTAIASVLAGFFRLPWWQMPLAVLGLLLIVSGPSVAIAWFKLHQRNLGPLLDANGWAVNARAKLNIPFGAALTGLARLPEGSKQSLSDPFAEKQPPWKLYLLLLLFGLIAFFAWKGGFLKFR